LEDLRRIVEKHFIVFEAYMELDGSATFVLPSAQDTKIPFQKLIEDLSTYNLLALLRKAARVPQRYQIFTNYGPLEKGEAELVLRIFPNREPQKTRSVAINVVLLIATILTISWVGLLQAQSYDYSMLYYQYFILYTWKLYGNPLILISSFIGGVWNSYADPIFLIIAFTVSLLAIVGLHEMGHYVTARRRGQKATLPYFIPYPPLPGFIPLGTFGAVIFQRTPTINRDRLFELGLMGPLTGLIVTLVVSVFSIYLSPILYPPIVYILANSELQIIGQLPFPQGLELYLALVSNGLPSVLTALYPGIVTEFGGVTLQFPILYGLLMSLLRPTSTLPLTIPSTNYPLDWAAWIGMLITSLNIFPIGMLDGGHMARSFLSQRQSFIAGLIAAAAMILISTAYFFMAILALLMMGRGHPGALDDVSPIARWKTAVWIVMIIVAIVTIPMIA
jgi:membrane-associated protease RseP (regulator of RpoE activity)